MKRSFNQVCENETVTGKVKFELSLDDFNITAIGELPEDKPITILKFKNETEQEYFAVSAGNKTDALDIVGEHFLKNNDFRFGISEDMYDDELQEQISFEMYEGSDSKMSEETAERIASEGMKEKYDNGNVEFYVMPENYEIRTYLNMACLKRDLVVKMRVKD